MYLRQPQSFPTPESAPEPTPSVYFNNRIPASSLDAPLITTLGCVGTNLVAELWTGPAGGVPTTPLSAPARVLPSGYVDPQENLVYELTFAPGPLPAQVRMWGQGPQFEIAAPYLQPPVNITQFVPVIGPLTPFPIFPEPSNTVAFVGQSAQFVATALAPGYSHEWQREDTNTATWHTLATTNSTLAWPAVTLADAGRYRVIVTYACTNRIYGPLTLSVGSSVLNKSATRGPGGALQFNVQGLAGQNYRLLHSTNLTTWEPGPLYPASPAQWTMTVTNTGPGHRFYQLITEP
jgi:hypothetical protein